MSTIFKGSSYYEEQDSQLFKGRDKESRELLYIVENNDFSVCYAESGEGKSSLINAGLIPLMRKRNLFPIRITFEDNDFKKDVVENQENKIDNQINFDKFIIDKIDSAILSAKNQLYLQQYQYGSLEFIKTSLDKAPDSLSGKLWWKLRNFELRRNTYETLTPVLIFDQFEEVFTHAKDVSWTDAFFKWLEELFRNESPDIEHYEKSLQKRFKILFSLRSEYVGELDYWSVQRYYIPDLKNNRYFLKALTKNAALEIANQLQVLPEGITNEDIVEYARVIKAGNDLPCISALPLSFLLTGLENSNDKIEKLVNDIVANDVNKKKIVFDNILYDYYTDAVSECRTLYPDSAEQEIIELEEKLITENGRRRRIKKSDIDVNPIILDFLIEKRIVREDGESIEITHDRLCEAISDRVIKRVEENKKRLMKIEKLFDWLALLPFAVFTGISMYIVLNLGLKWYLSSSSLFTIFSRIVSFFLYVFIFWGHFELFVTLYKKKGRYSTIVYFEIGVVLICMLKPIYWDNIFLNLFKANYTDLNSFSETWGRWVFMPLLIISFVVILVYTYLARLSQQVSDTDFVRCKNFFELIPARVYTLIILFVCLFACIFSTNAYGNLQHGEEIVFVFLICLITHSLFYRKEKLRRYIVPYLLYCLGFLLYDIFPWNPTFTIYFLLVVLLSMEFFFSRRYSMVRSTFISTIVICLSFLIISFASILYLGFLPYKNGKIQYVDKWHYYAYKKGDCFGARDFRGQELIPCIFDGLEKDTLIISDIKDSIFTTSAQDIHWQQNFGKHKTWLYEIKDNNLHLNLQILFLFSKGNKNIDEKTNKISFKAYQEMLELILRRLKYGNPTDKSLQSTEKLMDYLNTKATNQYNSLTRAIKESSIDYNSFSRYIETVDKELSISTLRAMLKNNHLGLISQTLRDFEETFFYTSILDYYTNKDSLIISGINLNYHVNINVEPKEIKDAINKFNPSFSTNAVYYINELCNYNYIPWYLKIDNTFALTRAYLTYSWAANMEVKIPLLYETFANANKVIIDSEKRKEKTLNDLSAYLKNNHENISFDKLLALAEEMQNDIGSNINNLKNEFSKIKMNYGHYKNLYDVCLKKRDEIKDIYSISLDSNSILFSSNSNTSLTPFISLWDMCLYNLMAICLLADEESANYQEAIDFMKNLEERDSTYRAEKYGRIMQQHQLEQKLKQLIDKVMKIDN